MNIKLEKQFVEMIGVCDELGKLETEYHEYEDKIEYLEEKVQQCELSLVGKIIVGIITFFGINIVASMFLSQFLGSIMEFYFIILVVVISVAIKYASVQYRIFKASDRQALEAKIDEEQHNLNGILTVMRAVVKMNDEAFNGMPEEYIYSIAIEEMHKYVKHGRANTIPEAINLYEEQLHRWKIEEQNGQLLDSQYRQEERLANIEFYSSLSAFFD